jgi:hypothetical protein
MESGHLPADQLSTKETFCEYSLMKVGVSALDNAFWPHVACSTNVSKTVLPSSSTTMREEPICNQFVRQLSYARRGRSVLAEGMTL